MQALTIASRAIEEGVVAWVIQNPRKRNALDPAALAWIEREAATLRGEVVLLSAADGPAFSAGFDLTALPKAATIDPRSPDAPLIAATAAMQAADATFIAVIDGYVIGAGVELCCACDLRVASREAWFLVPAARLGVVYHPAGLARFHAVFGPGLTRRLILLGDKLGAAEVAAVGAIARLVDPGEADAAALALARTLREAPQTSTRAHRSLLRQLDAPAGPTAAALADHEDARVAAYAELFG
ncbi:MAG: enoyl-CoA hydratase/isomerase family protein [Myxococcales bacterium]|nr:enoyl-CoA hydratase/isomerase family protein [Myxococcales bacterium]